MSSVSDVKLTRTDGFYKSLLKTTIYKAITNLSLKKLQGITKNYKKGTEKKITQRLLPAYHLILDRAPWENPSRIEPHSGHIYKITTNTQVNIL